MTLIYKNAKYELTFEKKPSKFKLVDIDTYPSKDLN